MKYYIENPEGYWLRDPDNGGSDSPWTRDPMQAWAFTEVDNISWGISMVYKDTAQHVLLWLREEELDGGYQIKEYDFEPLEAVDNLPTIYRDNITKDIFSVYLGRWDPNLLYSTETLPPTTPCPGHV